jgi:hypothetical protein
MMTDEEYASKLSFLVGLLYGTILGVRNSGQISVNAELMIKDRLKYIEPILDQVYKEGMERPKEEPH